MPIGPRRSTSAPSPISTRQSTSIRNSPPPSTTAASLMGAKTSTTAPSPISTKRSARAALQEVLEAEMTEALSAEKGERTAGRLGYRSGYYDRTLITRVGKLELRVPQDRAGRFST